MRQDVLDPHVDGGGDLPAGMGTQLVLKPHLQTRDAVIVRVGDTQQLRRRSAIGVITLGAGFKLQTR
jgi:hypothetical protein